MSRVLCASVGRACRLAIASFSPSDSPGCKLWPEIRIGAVLVGQCEQRGLREPGLIGYSGRAGARVTIMTRFCRCFGSFVTVDCSFDRR